MNEIVYRVETWQNGSKTGEVIYNEDEMDLAITQWKWMLEDHSTDIEVRLISPAC